MDKEKTGPTRARLWGEFRLSVIGGLLASPPKKGELKDALRHLATKEWRHPTTAQPVKFSFATLEEWFYEARKNSNDPVGALSTGRRHDRGHGRLLSEEFKSELASQYQRYPDWSIKLHSDNLRAMVESKSHLAPAPSYMTLLRYMKQNGLHRKKLVRRKKTPGMELAESRLERREVRSYELEHVGALWHLDYHHTGRKV